MGAIKPPKKFSLDGSYVCVDEEDTSRLKKLQVIGDNFQWSDKEFTGSPRQSPEKANGDCDLKALEWLTDTDFISYCYQSEESRMVLTPHSVTQKRSRGRVSRQVFNCISFD